MATASLRLAEIAPSALNPRRCFDAGALAELAASIQAVGLLEPLVVRPRPPAPGGEPAYEMVAGERRYRAAKLGGLAEVPVRVVELDDRGAAEAMLTENLQRADLTPIEEARAFGAWIKTQATGADGRGAAKAERERRNFPRELGARIGKSEDFVRERLALLNLAAKEQEAVEAGRLPLKVARLALRLPAASRERGRLLNAAAAGESTGELLAIASAAFVDLAHAPFDLEKSSPPCAGCPHRAMREPGKLLPALEPGAKVDRGVCTKPSCFQEKDMAWWQAAGARTILQSRGHIGKALETAKGDRYLEEVEAWKVDCPGCRRRIVAPGHWGDVRKRRMCAQPEKHFPERQRHGGGSADPAEKSRRKKELATRRARCERQSLALQAAFAWAQTRTLEQLASLAAETLASEAAFDTAKAAASLLGSAAKPGNVRDWVAKAGAGLSGKALVKPLAALIVAAGCGVMFSWSSSAPAEAWCKKRGIKIGRPARPAGKAKS